MNGTEKNQNMHCEVNFPGFWVLRKLIKVRDTSSPKCCKSRSLVPEKDVITGPVYFQFFSPSSRGH